jgi:uncharacterized protein (DUF885 family)
MNRRISLLAVASSLAFAALPASSPAQAPQAASTAPAVEPELVALWKEWRAFAAPRIANGLPDYGAAAMARRAAALPAFKARLAAMDRTGWSAPAISDYRLVEAEMNGLDFHHRVLKPWARDPSFYATVFGEESDVPAHEGPSAQPNVDLFAYRWPLSRADDRKLAMLLGAVPALLTQAKTNLAAGNAHDLFAYGNRAFRGQSEVLGALASGTLRMRTLEGSIPATMTGASPALRKAIGAAKAATDDFAAWIEAEAPKKTGPSGVGKEDYNWYEKHVALNPYDWDMQVALLKRELDRALASLALEETRNRAVPPLTEITDPAAYRAMALARTAKFNDLLVATGLMPDKPYFRAAMEAQTSRYTPPAERAFFDHGTALDPLPLLSHSSHWIELARIKHEPHPDPIRASAPLYNIFADRSEGFATAFEELVMHAGLYDDSPRSREIVWIMLANRAARGLASLHVQANEMTLAEAGRFHAEWTPRHWSDAASPLVGFEQLLYLRQPGYGPSYILGKLQLDELLALAAHEADQARRPFVLRDTWARIMSAGILPPTLLEAELFPAAGVR